MPGPAPPRVTGWDEWAQPHRTHIERSSENLFLLRGCRVTQPEETSHAEDESTLHFQHPVGV